MNNCPCKDCITFPICKAQVYEYLNSYKNKVLINERVYDIYEDILKPKCSILKDWINEMPIEDIQYKRFDNLYVLFSSCLT